MTHKAHKEIWLQVDPDGESCDPEQYDLVDDATWCQERINSNYVKYIRADIYDQLRKELETERMRNVACGVVAMADTPDSAKQARAMHPDYMSASCSDVARRVDECIKLREHVKMLRDELNTIYKLVPDLVVLMKPSALAATEHQSPLDNPVKR